MKTKTKRLLGNIALTALTAGTLGTVLLLRNKANGKREASGDRWARPGMLVTFRAELMPGRDASERTYRILELLPSNRVLLEGVGGEHMKNEFEAVRY
jgi:hypothetical protein